VRFIPLSFRLRPSYTPGVPYHVVLKDD
jgi:hypothetical protein